MGEFAKRGAPPKRCPYCHRVAFRTMTDYLCVGVGGCGWHEPHDEPIPTSDTPPDATEEP